MSVLQSIKEEREKRNFEKMQRKKEEKWTREHPTNARYKNTKNGCKREDINIKLVVIGHSATGEVVSHYKPLEADR